MSKTVLLALIAVLFGNVTPLSAADMEATPFKMQNQSPLVQIYGLPTETSAAVLPAGTVELELRQDVASNFAVDATAREAIRLDGESYRWTLAGRYGLTGGYDMGFDIPFVLYGGGFLDSFVIDWHTAFSLPQGGRDISPKDRILFSYRKDGNQKLNMARSAGGLGDISLNGGIRLYEERSESSHDSIAVRSALKLPTGDSGSLLGSGSVDWSLLLCGSSTNFTEWGSITLFGSLGGMVLSNGSVLADQQHNLAGLGSAGIGWGPTPWISFKFQLDAHTPFYRGSSLNELSKTSLMLISGGALKLPGDCLLDIGVSEDVAVGTSPDVGFHLGLSKKF